MKDINIVAENAHRLVADAELLFANKRYPTAVTLSIIAIEEAGKFTFLCKGVDSPSRRTHKEKQSLLGMWFWHIAIYDVFTSEFQEFCTYLQEKGRSENLEYLLGLSIIERIDYMKLLHFSESNDIAKSVELYVRSKFRYAEKLEILENACSGKLERKRQSGIYADIDSNAEATNDPLTIQKAEAESWLENARVAIEFMSMFQRHGINDLHLTNGSS